MQTIANFIDGEHNEPKSSSYFESVDPSTGKSFAKIPDSNYEDINQAVIAAKDAFTEWSKTSFKERSSLLRNIAKLIKKNKEELAQIESLDQGKPLWLARSLDIKRSSENFLFFASAVEHFCNTATQEQDSLNYTWKSPLGVVGLITPWNLPLYLLTWKIAPALAMGNTLVAKPSEQTSLSAFYLSSLLQEAGLPKGVVNFVFGRGEAAGEALVKHKDVPAISFTGGTKTGQKIYSLASKHCKKISLELGGKNAQIVFADCDLDKCLATSTKAAFLNQGEICLCSSRIFVEDKIYKEFVEKFSQKTNNIVVGPPSEEKSFIGAINSEAHLNKILSYVEEAKKLGGNILCGGERLYFKGKSREGYYMSPTVITDLDPNSKVMQEEVFGPLVCISPFKSEDEAISLANNVRYGLSASLWTSSLNRAHKISQKLDVGQVWVNTWMKRDLRTPFGGCKESGFGREGGKHSLDFFSEVKNICIQL